MLAEIESLLVLQDRDQRILRLEEDMKRIPENKERAKERLANDLAAVANAKKAVQDNEVAIKNVELDIGTRKSTLDRLKVQQYETKKNDEFTALGNEIVRYNDEVDQFETTELELMETADELRAAHQKPKQHSLSPKGWSTKKSPNSTNVPRNAKNNTMKSKPNATRLPWALMTSYARSTTGC